VKRAAAFGLIAVAIVLIVLLAYRVGFYAGAH